MSWPKKSSSIVLYIVLVVALVVFLISSSGPTEERDPNPEIVRLKAEVAKLKLAQAGSTPERGASVYVTPEPEEVPYTGRAYEEFEAVHRGSDKHYRYRARGEYANTRAITLDVGDGNIIRYNDPVPEMLRDFGRIMRPDDEPRSMVVDEESGLSKTRYWPEHGWIRTPVRSIYGIYSSQRAVIWLLFKGDRRPTRFVIGETYLGVETRPFKFLLDQSADVSHIEFTARYDDGKS